MRTDFDVVIAGGGAIGACQAVALRQLGYSVALIERRTPDFTAADPERVVALNDGSRQLLKRLGIWGPIEQSGTGRIRHILVTENGNSATVKMDAAEARRGGVGLDALGHVIEMGQLLQAAYGRLAETGVQLFPECVVRGFSADAQAVHVALAGRSDARLQARLLIGADGTHSQIRRMAGIPSLGWDYNRFGLVASIECERAHQETAFECFRASGPLAYLPLADGRYSIVWAVRPAEAMRLLRMDDDAFLQALTQATDGRILEQTGSLRGTSARASYALELSIAGRFTDKRLALIGNAAHTIHPVAGQGMNLGLRDVARLTATLDSSIGHRDPGQPIVMQAYAEGRRLDVAAVAAFTEAMADVFAIRVPGAKAARALGLHGMQRIAWLRDMLVEHAAGLAQADERQEVFCE